MNSQNQNPPSSKADLLSQRQIALLIDGDNASPRLIEKMLAETSKYGTVIVRRIYGNWTSAQMTQWKEKIQEHALLPMQQFPNVSGKNATDSALIIDAMDLLHKGNVGGFCIASSDSDYARLALRIREEGYFMMVIGDEHTHDSLRRACHVFVSTDNIDPDSHERGTKRQGSKKLSSQDMEYAIEILGQAFDSAVREDGYAHMANLGIALQNFDSAFDPRTFGKKNLVGLIEAFPDDFVVERRRNQGVSAVYVRRK